MVIIDVLQARCGIPQLRLLQQAREAAVLSQRPLLIDKEPQPILERQSLYVGLRALSVQRLSHTMQPHLA